MQRPQNNLYKDVTKRNYFTKYGQEAQQVLNALLEKYAVEGITTIESTEVLSLHPLMKMEHR